MQRLQLKIESWMEFQVPESFDTSKLHNLENMDLEEVIEITNDSNPEIVEIEDWYQDVRFLGQYWIESEDE